MNNQQKKNRWMVILIFGLSVIPFIFAWWLTGNTGLIKGKINHGDLIAPPVTTERNDLIGLDEFSTSNMHEVTGHWILVNLVPESGCNQLCLDAIHKSKQLRLMMNKDLTRIRRILIVMNNTPQETVQAWLKDDNVILKVRPSETLRKKLLAIRHNNLTDGALLIMDPLGNLMMQYAPGFDPYKVKSDLTHLLRISQIG